MPHNEARPADRRWRPYVPFAAAGAAVPLGFGILALWDGPPPAAALWALGIPLGAVAGALAAVPVLAAVRAGRPVPHALVAGLLTWTAYAAR